MVDMLTVANPLLIFPMLFGIFSRRTAASYYWTLFCRSLSIIIVWLIFVSLHLTLFFSIIIIITWIRVYAFGGITIQKRRNNELLNTFILLLCWFVDFWWRITVTNNNNNNNTKNFYRWIVLFLSLPLKNIIFNFFSLFDYYYFSFCSIVFNSIRGGFFLFCFFKYFIKGEKEKFLLFFSFFGSNA